MPQANRPPGRLADQGERLGNQCFERLATLRPVPERQRPFGQLRIGFGGQSWFQPGNLRQQSAIPRQPQATRSRQDVQNSLSDIQ